MRTTLPVLFTFLLVAAASAQDAAEAIAPSDGAEGTAPTTAASPVAKDTSAGDTSAGDTTVEIKTDRQSGRRVLRLTVADVGRLVLRNSPQHQVNRVEPFLVRTREDEALAEFDTLFAARAGFGRNRSPVFFNPTNPGSRGEIEQNALDGGAELQKRETWGGAWSLGYAASSTEERGTTSINSLQPRYSGALSLAYSHPLLRGAGEDITLSSVNQARENLQGSEHTLRRSAETIVANAEAAYWRLVGAIADRAVRRKSLKVAEELQSVAQARLDSGRGIKVEVTEARAGVEARRVDVIAAETAVANRADALRELVLPFTAETLDLALEVEPSDTPAVKIGPLPEAPVKATLMEAFDARGDVLAARSALAASKINESRAADDERARLDAVAEGGLSGFGRGFSQSTHVIGNRRTYDWRLGVEFSIPLGNEAAEARSRRARGESLRASRRLKLLENTAVREIREATRNVRSAAQQIEAAVRSREASQEQLSAEKSRLENGVATPFELLQVEEDLSEAEAREIQARVDYELARVSLELARGTLLRSRSLDALIQSE